MTLCLPLCEISAAGQKAKCIRCFNNYQFLVLVSLMMKCVKMYKDCE